jgi:very-short-patch-repair endonuclease
VERTLRRQVAFARQHRRRSTPAEARLWSFLRRQQLEGLYFRRQAPVGPYFADFICNAVRLAIEIDGASHHGRQRRDRIRDTFFQRRGITVLRFTNEQVLANTATVLDHIRTSLRELPPHRR